MTAWFGVNLGTIFVSLILCTVVAGIVYKLYKDKKQGKSSCGCNCANCAMHGSCHSK